ncbi:MAG: DUF896 domain-containing protein [Oscillospiraceae bacterium]
MITKEQIKRINVLARKSKTPEGLTEAERREQADLRRRYLDSIKESLTAQLDNTYVMDAQGNKRKLEKKDEEN